MGAPPHGSCSRHAGTQPCIPDAADQTCQPAHCAPYLVIAHIMQNKNSDKALPPNKQGILVTCDNGWEDRTADEVLVMVEEVRACDGIRVIQHGITMATKRAGDK